MRDALLSLKIDTIGPGEGGARRLPQLAAAILGTEVARVYDVYEEEGERSAAAEGYYPLSFASLRVYGELPFMPTNPPCQLTDTGSVPDLAPPSSAGACYLVRIYPPGLSENLITLRNGVTTLGRDVLCDIEVVDDFVSRHHATIELTEEGCWVSDNDSRNGTFVNDERIVRRQLQAGDNLRIGNQIFKYLSADHPETQYHEAVYQMMTSDGLTNVANRRYFDDCFRRELSRCIRHSRPIAVLLLDVDHFKRVNDLYGHLIGDECLKELCRRVQTSIRADDLFARIGGEEFAIVLSETQADDARMVAERVRRRVEETPFGRDRRLEIPLTVSIGVAHSDGAVLRSTEEFLADADKQLYVAKQSGRNCVCGPDREETTLFTAK